MRTLVNLGLILVFLLTAFTSNLSAAQIHLKNSDKISGEIVSETEDIVVIKSEATGEITINKDYVDKIVVNEIVEEISQEAKPAESLPQWEKNISVGYNQTSGNTENSQLSTKLVVHRKTDDDEFHLKGDTFFSSTNKKMDAQTWNGMTRYAYSFWERKWYNFYKIESNHDKFANINYRIIPSTGVGYWLADTDDFKAMGEIGIGAEYTNYIDSTKDETEPVLIPRAFLEKKLFKDSRISEDVYLYPSLADAGKYRLHSETVFTNPISEKLSLQISWINDYNSEPSAGTKKTDMKILSSLVYSF